MAAFLGASSVPARMIFEYESLPFGEKASVLIGYYSK